MKFIVVLTILILVAASSFAQNSSYIRSGSIGESRAESNPSKKLPPNYRQISQWIGEQFIFLPKPKGLQEYGYNAFFNPKYKHAAIRGIDYAPYVGKIAKVVSVTQLSGDVWEVFFELENGEKLKARTISGKIEDVAPIADIDNARTQYLGKTLWIIHRGGISTYNEQTDKYGKVNSKRFSPVKVVDIVAGSSEDAPVRFIVRTASGEEGFVGVMTSGTNSDLRSLDIIGFNATFTTEDPKKLYQWSDKVWSAIENEKVFLGMTAAQATLSWGKPKEVHSTINASGKDEQWVYWDNAYLHFDNGILTNIQASGKP